jgi:urease accessory protein
VTSLAALVTSTGWSARLDIDVIADGGRTRVRRAEHHGPLRIQRPFYPEGAAPAHLYLLHPPGGMVGGDRLEIAVQVRAKAELVVTTPAAQKIYRSAGAESAQSLDLRVESGASLEWLPAETLVFDGARTRLSTNIRLAHDAAFMGWDIGCFGRPASGLPFATGYARQELELHRGEELLLMERTRVEGGSLVLDDEFGYARWPCYGTLYCVPRSAAQAALEVDAVRAALAPLDRRAAVTAVDGVLVVRVLAAGIEAVRQPLLAAWSHLRPRVLGRRPVLPRIWAT